MREFQELLQAGPKIAFEAFDTGVDENADSYEGNAWLKASAALRATGVAALADDSGLEVAALDGYPGLRTARIAPDQEARNRLVLGRLAASGAPRPWCARFVCALALALPGMGPLVYRAEVDGEIVEPRDGGGGFGYDPLFLLPEVGRTFAELSPEEKHRRSHRGLAVRALLESGALGAIA